MDHHIIINSLDGNDERNQIRSERALLIKIPFFERLLNSEMKEKKTGIIEISENRVDIENYLKYLSWKYNSTTEPNFEFVELCQLIRLADMWLDKENLKYFVQQWSKNINRSTFNLALEFYCSMNLTINLEATLSEYVEKDFRDLNYRDFSDHRIRAI